MYASNLSALLDYCLGSVKTFDRLRELLICDRVKLSLPEACLRHVVAVESAGKDTAWLPLNQLTRTVHTFLANHKLTDQAVNRLTGCSRSISRVTAVSEGGVEGKNPTAVVMDDQTTVLSGANSDDVENPVTGDFNDSEVL